MFIAQQERTVVLIHHTRIMQAAIWRPHLHSLNTCRGAWLTFAMHVCIMLSQLSRVQLLLSAQQTLACVCIGASKELIGCC